MRITFAFVPPSGGETDYTMDAEVESIPSAGDYISITRPGQDGFEDFIVRRVWRLLEFPTRFPGNGIYKRGETEDVERDIALPKRITVECEFAEGPYSSEDHKKACETYKAAETQEHQGGDMTEPRLRFDYQDEQMSLARRALMAPHPRGEEYGFADAFQFCSLGFHQFDADQLGDDSARTWMETIRRLMDTGGVDDPTGEGTALHRARELSIDERRAFSDAVDALASWFNRKFWSDD